MSSAVMTIIQPFQSLVKSWRRMQERERNLRRLAALSRVRDGFAALGYDLDPLTDEELEHVVVAMSSICGRVIEAKRRLITVMLDRSVEGL